MSATLQDRIETSAELIRDVNRVIQGLPFVGSTLVLLPQPDITGRCLECGEDALPGRLTCRACDQATNYGAF